MVKTVEYLRCYGLTDIGIVFQFFVVRTIYACAASITTQKKPSHAFEKLNGAREV